MHQRKMLILSFILICFTTAIAHAVEQPADYLTWDKIELLESKLKTWSAQQGDEKLIEMAKAEKLAMELDWAIQLFPHLLPQQIPLVSLHMDCYVNFRQYQKQASKENYQQWTQCINSLYNSTPPEVLQLAMKQLQPQAK